MKLVRVLLPGRRSLVAELLIPDYDGIRNGNALFTASSRRAFFLGKIAESRFFFGEGRMHPVLASPTMSVLFNRTVEEAEVYRATTVTAILIWIIATWVCNPRLSYCQQTCS